ncbi:histidine kinase [Actinomyces culturomici]|nr:histidine kinase [Actinomyces culturomici]
MSAFIHARLVQFRSYVTRYRRQQRDELQFCMDRPIYGALIAR